MILGNYISILDATNPGKWLIKRYDDLVYAPEGPSPNPVIATADSAIEAKALMEQMNAADALAARERGFCEMQGVLL